MDEFLEQYVREPYLSYFITLVGCVMLYGMYRMLRGGTTTMSPEARLALVRRGLSDVIVDYIENAVYKNVLSSSEAFQLYNQLADDCKLLDLRPSAKLSMGRINALKREIRRRIATEYYPKPVAEVKAKGNGRPVLESILRKKKQAIAA